MLLTQDVSDKTLDTNGGGRGFIGSRLTTLLHNQGHEVIHISRSPGADRVTWTELKRSGLPRECRAVVNLAGENLMNPMKRWDEDFKQDLYSSRINTTNQLVHMISQANEKPEVFINASATGYYKPHPTHEYTEDSPGGDFDFLSHLVTDWEEEAKLPVGVDVRQAIIRIGVALGREGGAIQSMFIPFYLGLGGPIASGQQWFPWIHVDDVTGIIHHAIENETVTGVLNAVSPQPATNSEFTKAFGHALWRPAFIPVPTFMLNAVFGTERASVLTEGSKIIPKRTLESGYKFIYPDLQSACAEFAHLVPMW